MLNGFSYPTPYPHQIPKEGYTPSDSMIRLLAAAVINRRFRDLLLRNPGLALSRGYGGESFTLTPGERKKVLSIQAENLQDFALQITSSKEEASQEGSLEWIPIRQNALVLEGE